VTNVNLDPSQLPDYQIMVANHWDKLIKGIATHTLNLPAGEGGGSPTQGTYPNPTLQAEFAALPQTVYFAFGWDDHTHNYNCVNPDNGNGVEDNLANRGVQTNSSGMYIAQITVHQDHVFWDTLEHEGEPLRFDPIAAWAPQNTSVTDPFWINDLTSQELATTFSDGTPLPDRGPYMTGNNLPFTSDMSPPSYQVIMNTQGVNTVPSTDYPDFMEFSVQSQMHLNAQGLCYIIGQHSADPYFTPNVAAVPYGDPEVVGTPTGGVTSAGQSSSGSSGGSSGSTGTTGGTSSSSGGGSSAGTTGGVSSGGSSSGSSGGSTGNVDGGVDGGTPDGGDGGA
jgi:hypothetical protein